MDADIKREIDLAWAIREREVAHLPRKRDGVDGSHTITEWYDCIKQFGYRCALCHKPFTPEDGPTRDHIVPVARHELSSNDIYMIQPAHKSCNKKRGDLLLYVSVREVVESRDIITTRSDPFDWTITSCKIIDYHYLYGTGASVLTKEDVLRYREWVIDKHARLNEQDVNKVMES